MSGDVVVVVPWRGGCPHREAAWGWVRPRYDGYELVVAECPPGPWVKALAVMPAIQQTDAPVIVIADADCWSDGLVPAIDAVRDGAPWAVPHRRVKRLSEKSTQRLYAGELPDRLPTEEPSYVGAAGGGLVVIPRETALDVPLDPRFEGWGAEDRSWGFALSALIGEPWRGRINLFHLWHPPQERPDRNHGNAENEALRRRYIDASRDPVAMRALIEEIPNVLKTRDTRREHGRDGEHPC